MNNTENFTSYASLFKVFFTALVLVSAFTLIVCETIKVLFS